MTLFNFRWYWDDLSLNRIVSRWADGKPHHLTQLFALRCGLCKRLHFGCDEHWFCGMCQSCKNWHEEQE